MVGSFKALHTRIAHTQLSPDVGMNSGTMRRALEYDSSPNYRYQDSSALCILQVGLKRTRDYQVAALVNGCTHAAADGFRLL